MTSTSLSSPGGFSTRKHFDLTDQSVSYKVRQQSHHLITTPLNIIKLIIITTLVLEMGLAFRSIGVSTKTPFRA